jgi:hypothetical protein
MNSAEEAQYDSFIVTKNYLDAHPTIFSGVPAAAAAITTFNSLMTRLEEAIQLQATNSEGAMDDKAEAREAVIAAAMPVVGGLQALFASTGDRRMQKESRLVPSDLRRMSDNDFFAEVSETLDIATQNLTDLPNHGVSAAMLTDAGAAFEAWRDVQGGVGHAIAEGEKGTAALKRLLPQIQQHIGSTLDNYMLVVAAANPDLQAEWDAVREINDAPTDTRALTVTVTAIQAGASVPVAGASAVINPGDVKKTTGAEGSFYVQSLPAGYYTLDISKPGYQPLAPVSFSVADGEMTSLNIVLEVDASNQ